MRSPLESPIAIIAPHPDDETLAAGGTLIRAKKSGAVVHWIIVTEMRADSGWPQSKIDRRRHEIDALARQIGFDGVHQLGFPSTKLDTVPVGDLVEALGTVIKLVEPRSVLLPHKGDAHSDHSVTWSAGAAVTKWFRYPSVECVMSYEALSETEAGIDCSRPFIPNLYVDISETLEEKLRACEIFDDEFGAFPFPRSEAALRAQAALRGATAGFDAAEAFMVHRERR